MFVGKEGSFLIKKVFLLVKGKAFEKGCYFVKQESCFL